MIVEPQGWLPSLTEVEGDPAAPWRSAVNEAWSVSKQANDPRNRVPVGGVWNIGRMVISQLCSVPWDEFLDGLQGSPINVRLVECNKCD
jgi:hypothetical protein